MPPQDSIGQHFSPGQTVLFLGDHTGPDNPGYVAVMGQVLARFHPELKLKLLSAGSKGQTAQGLRSRLLMEILASSRPDWLVIGVGLGDVLREPQVGRLLVQYQTRQAGRNDLAEAIFGPEHRPHTGDPGPRDDAGPELESHLERLTTFRADLAAAVAELAASGVRSILLTTVLLGDDLDCPVNNALKLYSKAIREVANEEGAALVDVERAFRALLDRASSYKQKVTLTGADGTLNPQGEALLARTFLNSFGALPNPGFRPSL
ncbi:MAG: hypothetical protein IVW55_08225 [Chloroflexi bacterium]|nr:hypothetical protein [Chloroflexota bacterium]